MDYESYLNAASTDDGAGVSQHIANGFPADVELPNGQGGNLSILHLVAFQGHENSSKALLDGGANPNILDSGGEPPIKMAIVSGHSRVVKLLLDYGANANFRMPGGETPLHVAAMSKETAIAQMLVDYGANPDTPNDMGITPRQIGGFQAMKSAGWDTSKPNTGGAFVDNLNSLDDSGLEGMLDLLPAMVEARLKSGEITGERAARLKNALVEFGEAKNLPLEIRSTRMKEISKKLMADLGMPQAFR